jgi:hypothetical protein
MTEDIFELGRANREERARKEQAAREQLFATGYFLELIGPKGGIPIQAWGLLPNGEEMGFRARNREAYLVIGAQDSPETVFRRDMGDDWQSAGLMEPQAAASLIAEWVGPYLKSKGIEVRT